MTEEKLKVLFLCTGNSARSIMAEALLQKMGQNQFEAYSAGSIPKGYVNPFAIEVLKANNFNTDMFRSKSWDEFEGGDAPKLDFVFTVCDNAANELCPIWAGHPISAHWGIEDPDNPKLSDDEQRTLFQSTYRQLEHRIKIFTDLSFNNLDSSSLQKELDDIGKIKLD
ncbi:MAG: arsenate reductase ArsC [Gammaproteobacteria bacterium]|nr:MAG: arsenate reductase ArsC [Gammaproteobacteria bacterium]